MTCITVKFVCVENMSSEKCILHILTLLTFHCEIATLTRRDKPVERGVPPRLDKLQQSFRKKVSKSVGEDEATRCQVSRGEITSSRPVTFATATVQTLRAAKGMHFARVASGIPSITEADFNYRA